MTRRDSGRAPTLPDTIRCRLEKNSECQAQSRVVHEAPASPVSLAPRPGSKHDPASFAFDDSIPISDAWGDFVLDVSFRDAKTGDELAVHSLRASRR